MLNVVVSTAAIFNAVAINDFKKCVIVCLINKYSTYTV